MDRSAIPAMPPDVLTTQQAAELLLCTPETIEAAARRHELPGLKFGREWVFPRAALLEVLNRKALAQLQPAHAAASPGPVPAGRPMLKAVPPAPPARRGGRRTPPSLPPFPESGLQP